MKKAVFYVEFVLFLSVIAATVGLFSYIGTKSLENKPVSEDTEKNYPVIILDAGHGGADGGATSKSGISEKDLNLDYTKTIAAYLQASGYEVALTRDGDYMLTDGNKNTSKKRQDLENRLAFAEKYPDSIFISIHMNSFPQEQYSGLQVYYSANGENTAESRMLAAYIQSFAHNFLQNSNERQIKPATSAIFILDKIKIPAALVECGFLSNEEEAAALATDEYRQKLALVISCAVEEYINSRDKA